MLINSPLARPQDDLNWERRPYHPRLAYGQSKLCNILHALELSLRLQGTQVTAVSVHPGEVSNTGLYKHDGFIGRCWWNFTGFTLIVIRLLAAGT